MSSLYDTIRSDMHKAYKQGYADTANTLKVLLSDIQRDPNKDYSDEKVLKVIKQTIKLANEAYKNGMVEAKATIQLLSTYLPKQVSEEIIRQVIEKIDFSKLKNKYQAVGLIMAQFPDGTVDGTVVKQLIDNKFNK